MAEEQRAAQNVPVCTPLPMNPTVLTTAHSGGYLRDGTKDQVALSDGLPMSIRHSLGRGRSCRLTTRPS
jgi:hypothetical protein